MNRFLKKIKILAFYFILLKLSSATSQNLFLIENHTSQIPIEEAKSILLHKIKEIKKLNNLGEYPYSQMGQEKVNISIKRIESLLDTENSFNEIKKLINIIYEFVTIDKNANEELREKSRKLYIEMFYASLDLKFKFSSS